MIKSTNFRFPVNVKCFQVYVEFAKYFTPPEFCMPSLGFGLIAGQIFENIRENDCESIRISIIKNLCLELPKQLSN